MDSWRVKDIFKSNNRVSYEVISSYMHKLMDHPKITKGILFESYPSTKKFLLCNGDQNGEVEVEVPKDRVNEGVAMCKVDILQISKFIVAEPGEPYCKILIKHLKILNMFLGTTINNSKIEFSKEDDGHNVTFLFLVDKEHYCTDVRLTTTKS